MNNQITLDKTLAKAVKKFGPCSIETKYWHLSSINQYVQMCYLYVNNVIKKVEKNLITMYHSL